MKMPEPSVRITFVTPQKKRKRLDQIAEVLGTSLNSVLNDAVDHYIELNEWQATHIKKGLEQARKRDFASDKEDKKVFEKYGKSA
jgi:predicted transcriptional regulator